MVPEEISRYRRLLDFGFRALHSIIPGYTLGLESTPVTLQPELLYATREVEDLTGMSQ